MAANRDPLAGKRLDSWKEIAAFFGRAERTVKRWESERGLPVHRVPGSGRSSVFAYSEELSEWLKGKGAEIEADDSTSGEIETASSETKSEEIKEEAKPETGVPHFWPVLPEVGTTAPHTLTRARLLAWLVPLALAGGLIVFLWAGHNVSTSPPTPSKAQAKDFYLGPDSVAVLPFANVRADASTDYLSDGITEQLISNLAHVPQLKVRSRDSVFRYKGKDLDLQTIGSNLRVSVLVSGRVLLQGGAVEISTELTDVHDNTEMWGKRYSGKTADLISLQQQMAGDIAEKLRSTLSASDRQQVTRQGTQNPDAYALYLKGRYAWNKRTRADLEFAISSFNQAIAKDPEYALAYSGLADAYAVLHFFGGDPHVTFPKSNAAAHKALELDASLARPHAVLGNNEVEYDWDFAGGEAEFRKAIELDPNDATAHQWYAEKLSALGRHQEALAEINRAHELDPLSPVIGRVLGGTLLDAGQYNQGIAVCRQLAQENPTFAIAHDCLFYGYWDKRMYPQAIEEWKLYAPMTGDPADAENLAALDRGFQSGGWPAALSQLIEVLEKRRQRGYESPFMIARLYADGGDKEKAFQWLDLAYREHDSNLIAIAVWPQFASLHSDPRYADLLAKIGLPKN